MKMTLERFRTGLALMLVCGLMTAGCEKPVAKKAPVANTSSTGGMESASGEGVAEASGGDDTPVKLVLQQAPTPGVPFESIGELTADRSVVQAFKPGCSEIHTISFSTATYDGRNTAPYTFVLQDAEGAELFRKQLLPEEIETNGYTKVRTGGIEVDASQMLSFTISTDIGARGNAMTIWRTAAETATDDAYAVIDGERVDYNLYFRVFGR